MKKVKLLLLGAGLANSLLAYRLKQRFPQEQLLVLDELKQARIDRTWSFHEKDLDPTVWEWLKPLASKIWAGYDVYFPSLQRSFLGSCYAAIRGEDFYGKLKLGDSIRWGEKIVSVKNRIAKLHSGEEIEADLILDGRGFSMEPNENGCGYQKFLGLQLRLKNAHGITRPILMDATIDQTDGYRFFYLLPWDSNRLLVEDTYYGEDAFFDKKRIRQEITSYVEKRGWEIDSLEGEESAALPIPFHSNAVAGAVDKEAGVVRVGVAADLFHPTTGYSLPYAAHLAEKWDPYGADAISRFLSLGREMKRSHGFYHLLNRFLFLGAAPKNRWSIFEKFYGLPENTIQRFYAGDSEMSDMFRVLSGKPPISIGSAFSAAFSRRTFL